MFIEPVFGKNFFGREEVLATLHKRVTAMKGGYRQNLALTGPMLTGKSSILRHFLKSVKTADIIPLYIELSDDDFEMFCTRFMATLLFNYLKTVGEKHSGDFKEMQKDAKATVPSTVAAIKKIIGIVAAGKRDKAYEKVLELPAVFKKETGKNCIVIMDEFHNISNFRLKKPFNVFGKFIMLQKSTMYVVTSSQKSLLKDILARKLSLLFGNFELLEIEGFDDSTARSFTADMINLNDVSEDIINYVIQITNGNPFYIELIVKTMSDYSKKGKSPSDPQEWLLSALSSLLYESDGILNQYFMNNVNFFLEKSTRRQFIPILISMANGHNRISEIQKYLGRTDTTLGKKLKKLQFMDLVRNSGLFYVIDDKLFEFWLKNVYGLKLGAVVDDMDIKYLEFKKTVEDDLKKYYVFNSKKVEKVVEGLFGLFNGEQVAVNRQNRRFPKFDIVRNTRVSNSTSGIVGVTGTKAWVCHIKKEDMVTENDVALLADPQTVFDKVKIMRRILIPLNGIEHNAFLLAKEQNIWIWDQKKLNEMLRLYGSFEIVL
jgi:ATPase domain predominantly from Archaea